MTPEQLKNNNFKSDSAVQFMYESLEDLKMQLNNKLHFLYGNPHKSLKQFFNSIDFKFDNVYVTKDYSFYSQQRDEKLKQLCIKNNINFISIEDHMLNNYGTIKTTTNDIYSKFTPYYNKASSQKIKQPQSFNYLEKIKTISFKNFVDLDFIKQFFIYKSTNIIGGRNNGLKQLKQFNSKLYDSDRNNMIKHTSQLSSYIKFGCVSIREVYHKFKTNELFIRQLFWHDFYTTLGHKDINFTQERLYQPNGIKWLNNTFWNDWKNGTTGHPIVDAAMRQLNTENYCHNRGRLIASGFIKFMFMDWKIAEQYYAQNLRDYSPYANHYNWNWSMSFGPFSTPYFRIMNVWIQSKKYDKDCEYIKKWIPELKDVPNEHIHKWYQYHNNYKNINYPKPIVDYKKQREICLENYKKYI